MGILEQKKKDIKERLDNAKVSTIILLGDTGMGKTWIVREISEHEGSCYETLWVYMTKNYDINLFYKDIAMQYLSPSPITEEWEHKDEEWERKDEECEHKEENEEVRLIKLGHREEKEEAIDDLKEKIQEKMKETAQILSRDKTCLLLVLDNEGDNLIDSKLSEGGNLIDSKLSEGDNLIDSKLNNILREWISIIPSKFRNSFKIIITTRSFGGDNAEMSKVIRLPRLEKEELSTLLRNSVDKNVAENPSFSQLDQAVAERSDGKPAAIIVIAKALNYIARHDDSKLGSAISKAVHYGRTSEGVNPLFYCAFDMIEDSVTKICFWHSIQLFCYYGGVNYNVLITYWIMEGYFDPFDIIEEAYWKGHEVLMKLIDRALLKVQENNIVAVEREALNIIKSWPHGFNDHTAALRLFSVFNEEESLGRVTRMDGMIKTLCNPKFWENNSTLLIDDSHLSQEAYQTSFKELKELRVLAVFKGRCESLISSLSEMDKLFVLVLRRCHLQGAIGHIKKLKTLKVLEISGDESNSMSIADDFLDEMSHLESLNLSGLSMKWLPSFSELSELRVLILRQLTSLKEAESLIELDKLEILDFSGASSFKSLPNSLFPKLSKRLGLPIDRPMTSLNEVVKLKTLRVLILSKCSSLENLQSLRGLGELEVLDVSDATSFESFDDISFSVIPKIQKVDLSNTKIQTLPEFHRLKDLKQILLRGCRNLRSLPELQLLTSLQILDLKGAVKFDTFTDESIADLDQLRILDLSETSIRKLPLMHRNLVEERSKYFVFHS